MHILTLNLVLKSLVFFVIFHYLHNFMSFILFLFLTFHISFFLYVSLLTRPSIRSCQACSLPYMSSQTHTHTHSLSLPLSLSLSSSFPFSLSPSFSRLASQVGIYYCNGMSYLFFPFFAGLKNVSTAIYVLKRRCYNTSLPHLSLSSPTFTNTDTRSFSLYSFSLSYTLLLPSQILASNSDCLSLSLFYRHNTFFTYFC